MCMLSCWVMSNSVTPMDYSPPGSSVYSISQVRILKWVAISFSRGSSWPRDQTCISCIGRWIFTTEPRGKQLNKSLPIFKNTFCSESQPVLHSIIHSLTHLFIHHLLGVTGFQAPFFLNLNSPEVWQCVSDSPKVMNFIGKDLAFIFII